MRKLIAVVLGAALLAGCAAAPAASESAAAASGTAPNYPAPTEEPTAAEDPAAYDTTDRADRCVGSAGGFWRGHSRRQPKTAKAAAVLVEYLSCSDLDADVMADWCTGLTDDQKELLDLNWPGILSEAEAICGDPAGEADELITAGVTTDFENMALTEVPDKLVTVNTVLTGKAG